MDLMSADGGGTLNSRPDLGGASRLESSMASWGGFGAWEEYWRDAWQRGVLFLDILRERGDTFRERAEAAVPHVLGFEAELVCDGRSLERPVNYLLVRILPPDGRTPDPSKPPFIVVDPRAGHGPGIGGMKQDSEIGMALQAGHPCYFIGFLPEPVPGQTVEDVCRAEAVFVADVGRRHPEAEGKPVIIANCQAGWQIMMMAALNPDLPGPIMLAGSPLSYWAGVRGKNPLRYLGGTLGGTWLTALAGDLGGGLFDGAWLVANFESMNPVNTFWQKPYNVYSKVDTEGARFLDFETWWGSPVLLGAGEMQWIADNLFVGDKLASGALRTSDGERIDLRNIKSPIIVFCSWGDDITSPQQALGWITDIYGHEREIAAGGQTIVYTLHQSIGHLGIFVSGKVATKEHRKFTGCMDLVDLMPPGLYEAVITEVDDGVENADLVDGRYLFRLEPRTLEDVRAIVENSPEDDQRFAAAARISEINLSLYQTFAAALVRMCTTEATAETLRRMHPNRLRFALFSSANPSMRTVAALAEQAREDRTPVSADNPLLAAEQAMASWIKAWWEAYGAARDAATETFFLNTYGSPIVQAMAGLGPEAFLPERRIERDLAREASAARSRAELEARFEEGGAIEAAVRALIYVRRPQGSIDERSAALIRRIRDERAPDARRTVAEFKDLLKEQSLLIRLNEEHAVQAIPKLLPDDPGQRRMELETLHEVIAAQGALPDESRRRLHRVDALYATRLDQAAGAELGNA